MLPAQPAGKPHRSILRQMTFARVLGEEFLHRLLGDEPPGCQNDDGQQDKKHTGRRHSAQEHAAAFRGTPGLDRPRGWLCRRSRSRPARRHACRTARRSGIMRGWRSLCRRRWSSSRRRRARQPLPPAGGRRTRHLLGYRRRVRRSLARPGCAVPGIAVAAGSPGQALPDHAATPASLRSR